LWSLAVMSDDLSAALVEEQLQRAVATALRDEEDDVRDLYGAVGVAALMGDPPPAPPPPQQPQQPAAPAADVHVPQPGYSAAAAELAAKMVDLRNFAKPPTFDGSDASWHEWKFRFMNVMSLLGLSEALELSARQPREIPWLELSPSHRERAVLVYNILVTVVSGRALSLTRMVKYRNGYECWRSLVKSYEPPDGARYAAILQGIMKPTWSADPARFEEELRAWELRVERYETVTGVPVPDQIRCATVSQYAPQAVKVFLRLVPQDYLQNYQLLREAIVTYLSRGRVYSAEGASLNTWAQTVPVPMEIRRGQLT